MLKLINNEFIKLNKFKLIAFMCIFLFVILLTYYANDKMLNINNLFTFISFIEVLIVTIFNNIISTEVNEGTFRFYLTKPVKRWKVYISKYLTILLFTLITLIFTFVIYIILSKNFSIGLLKEYILLSIPLLLISSLIMILSSLFKNNSITITILLCLIIFSSVITELLLMIDFKIICHTFLPYLDLNVIRNTDVIDIINSSYKISLTMQKGIIINIMYTLLFLILGVLNFNKKDIKN